MPHVHIVVPCYNEGRRLPVHQFRDFARLNQRVRFIFVDDGSKDDTLAVLQDLRQSDPLAFDVVALPRNCGKGEAVRQGCLTAFAHRGDYVGYWDADLATPLEAIADFLGVFQERPAVELVCGARVQLLGRSIRRSAARHYLGRVFATAASLTLGLGTYDTQCGAKLFRTTDRMKAVFHRPFTSRWLFDIEILARLMISIHLGQASMDEIVNELPLRQWHDMAGSKVKPLDFFKGLVELASLHRRYFSRRTPAHVQSPSRLPAPSHARHDHRAA